MNRGFTRIGLKGIDGIELTRSVASGISSHLKNQNVGFKVAPEPVWDQGDEIKCIIVVRNQEISTRITLCLKCTSEDSARFENTVPDELAPWLNAQAVNEVFEKSVTNLAPSIN